MTMDIFSSLGSLIGKTQWRLKAALDEEIRRNGLEVTSEQWMVILFVQRDPGISQAEVARRTMKDKTNITRMLDVLERRGLIERKPHPEDRRAYRLFLTPAGRRVFEQLERAAESVNRRGREGISAAELKMLERVCRQIWNNLEPPDREGSHAEV